jgi:hypothetical protein
MKRRVELLSVVALTAILGSGPPTARAAEVERTWCMTYCDVIYIGCSKTFGWFDEQACEEWKEGCMDGCRAAA